jgi:hypothetical protein
MNINSESHFASIRPETKSDSNNITRNKDLSKSAQTPSETDTVAVSNLSMPEYLMQKYPMYDGVIDLREEFPDFDFGPRDPTYVMYARIDRATIVINLYSENREDPDFEGYEYNHEYANKISDYVWEATGGRPTEEELAGIDPKESQAAIDLFQQTGKRTYIPENSMCSEEYRVNKGSTSANYSNIPKSNQTASTDHAKGATIVKTFNGDVIELETGKLIQAGNFPA